MAKFGMPGGIYKEVITVTTTGSAGSATGSTTSNAINGLILGVYFDFHASAAATTDTTVAYGSPAHGNLVVITSSKTDAFHLIRKQATDVAGAAITGVYDLLPIAGTLTVSLAECDALTAALVATVYYMRQ
jgi:hypothetical protein